MHKVADMYKNNRHLIFLKYWFITLIIKLIIQIIWY